MLIHGRLVVTHNGLMLDEVKSLLQKSLRRQELDLAYRATKELIGYEKDQLPWKSVITFMFEDHCLTDVGTLEIFYNCYKQKNKYMAIEILGNCFTCRHAACLQVVALDEEYRPSAELWNDAIPLDPDLVGLVVKSNSGIDCDKLLSLIVKNWKERNTKGLTTLFSLVNMAAKVENRTLSSKGIAYLLDAKMKKPSLYHLVLSALNKASTTEYMAKYTLLCYKFASIDDTPQGLIAFSILSQAIFKDKVTSHVPPDLSNTGKVNWNTIPNLDQMPSWAVDKHTFRGKFGKETAHIFKKKFRSSTMTDNELVEFHGPRPKTDLRTFFDVGCVCNNDILEENPIWEKSKAMYLKQKPSLQKCSKMTKAVYQELKANKAVVFEKTVGIGVKDTVTKIKLKRKLTSSSSEGPCCSEEPKSKQMKMTVLGKNNAFSHTAKESLENVTVTKLNEAVGPFKPTSSGNISVQKTTSEPQWPLLQLPTGSAKVHTRLNNSTMEVWKGPYKTSSKQNLCIFFHRAMKEVFQDKHTMDLEIKGPFIIFPLLKSDDADIKIVHKEFYDCIDKKQVSVEDGVFITRESLGLVQLHVIAQEKIYQLPESIWAHFGFRYILNIGDSGLYNAIATGTLDKIYGIDMEENRAAVKGKDIVNLMFTKMPRKAFVAEILNVLKLKKTALHEILSKDFDFDRLQRLFIEYGVHDETERCRKRLQRFKNAVLEL